ncbi:hypothetical protein D3C84_730450 [compost metagenome]
MREAGGHASGDHGDAADGQGRDTVEGGDGEGAVPGQRRGVRCAAVAEVFLIDLQLTAIHVEAFEGYAIVVVVDVQHQVRGAGVTVRVGDGVGEGFAAVATAVQGFEIGIAGVQRVGVSAVGIQHQGAVSAGEGPGSDRAAVFTDQHPVGALHIVAQHVAVEGQQGFRGR